MKKYHFSSLLLLVLITSASAQVTITTGEQPKMTKSQGTYSFKTHTGPRSDTNVGIDAILEDKSGNIWAATMGEGVYRYDGKSFKNFTTKDGLITNLVYSMMEDRNGNIWFGTTGGASRYDGKSFKNFQFSAIKGNSIPPFETNTTALEAGAWNENTEVWSIFQDKNGKIWFGTTDGIYCYDGFKFTSIAELTTTIDSSLKLKTVVSIAEDNLGNIWYSSWADGLCRFDGKTVTNVKRDGKSGGFNKLLLDKKGNIWLGRRGAEGGVYRFDGADFTKVFPGMPYIWEMTEDKSGNIWFSNVPDGGVIYFNPSTSEIISHFKKEDGLPHNQISCITIDKSGKVWFGTNGMTLSNYDGKTFTSFLSE